jgi:hypothetical protein
MDERTRRTRSARRQLPAVLALALLLMLGLAACGGEDPKDSVATLSADDTSSDDSSGGSDGKELTEEERQQAMLDFARCMRDHGVDMPDPQRDAGGGILLKSGRRGPQKGEKGTTGGPLNDHGPLGDPKFQAAQKACGKYLQEGGGAAMSPAEQAKTRDAFVAYARCMRGKGINMPDPKVTTHGIRLGLGPGNDPNSTRFKAADTACHPILAGVEPKGAKKVTR